MGFGLVFAGLADGTGRIRTVRSVGATGVPDLARRAARAELRTGRVVVATREFFGGDIGIPIYQFALRLHACLLRRLR